MSNQYFKFPITKESPTQVMETLIGNAPRRFRDNFTIGSPDLTLWHEEWINRGDGTAQQGVGIVERGGNATGSSYLRINLDPSIPGSQYTLTSKVWFRLPSKFAFNFSHSQKVIGQEFEYSFVGCDNTGNVVTFSQPADLTISGSVSVTANVATINFAAAHGLVGDDRVILVDNTDPRINVGPVLVTVVTSTQITVPLTIANGTYTAGGVVRVANYDTNTFNSVGFCTETATATNARWFTRRNGRSIRSVNATIATSAGTQSNPSPYTDAWNSSGEHEFYAAIDQVSYNSKTPSALTTPAGNLRWSEGLPDEENWYKLRIRSKNLDNIARPIAKITAIAKTGTTTATVTTDVAHGLSTSSWVQIYGVRDQTNFPNLTATTQVASIVSPTQFTIIIGSAATANSTGGSVILNNGGILAASLGFQALAVQSIVRTSNIMTITVNTTATGALPGEMFRLHGCDATSMGLYDGAYKILRMTGSTYEVESIGADFVSINCGGNFYKSTCNRLHGVRELEHSRIVSELYNQNGVIDPAKALPVAITNTPAVTVSSGTVTTVSTVTAVTTSNGRNIPNTLVADVASAAITTTANTSAITPASGNCYEVNIPVTAVTGTTPTMDVNIEESDDSGTNWFVVYSFPRITATGIYRSPQLPFKGNRIRYTQTIGGTTPSFTRAINRIESNTGYVETFNQLFDRSIVLTTLNSVTPSLNISNARTVQLVINIGAATTAPVLQLEGSDDNGVTWYSIGSVVNAAANTIVAGPLVDTQAGLLRARISTPGATVTAGYVLIKGFKS